MLFSKEEKGHNVVVLGIFKPAEDTMYHHSL